MATDDRYNPLNPTNQSCPKCRSSWHVEQGPSGGFRCNGCKTTFLVDENRKIVEAFDAWGDPMAIPNDENGN